ncbi:type VII secretion target [Mycolicibacterium sp. J2]|jgi:hypothetical protein|uniref:type VII secretion target n=1 Tax=Mycolicibacterium sp. J2 TaxID=2993511 RepID=UPI00224A877C|nr:type VII secretion target [Mycolicibacterium sp. J2]MCX2715957.1 type VII secretion target [Mycolicibacterium sp. J2]
MGEAMRTSDEGLRDLAEKCCSVAAALAYSAADQAIGLPFQSTTSAVHRGHELVAATADGLAARATSVGAKLSIAADLYAQTDRESADRITGAGPSIKV